AEGAVAVAGQRVRAVQEAHRGVEIVAGLDIAEADVAGARRGRGAGQHGGCGGRRGVGGRGRQVARVGRADDIGEYRHEAAVGGLAHRDVVVVAGAVVVAVVL